MRVPALNVEEDIYGPCDFGLACRLAAEGESAARYKAGTDMLDISGRVFQRDATLVVEQTTREIQVSHRQDDFLGAPPPTKVEKKLYSLPASAHVVIHLESKK